MKATKKILVIDDEEDIRDIICEFCELNGYECVKASNGKEAIEIFNKEKFDIVFSDIKMPDIDGYEFVKKIKEVNKKIPIVIISGFIDDRTKNKFNEIGIDFYLEKPFKLSDIDNLIQKLT